MNTKIAIAGIVLVLVGGALFYYQKPMGSVATTTPEMGTTTPAATSTATTTSSQHSGTLKGQVTIGPVCPVENSDHPCTPTAEMYAAAKVFVYKMDKKTLVKTITPDATGHFAVFLPVGDYFIDMIHQRIGETTDVPTTVTILSDKSVTLSLSVDTGLR